MTELLRLITSSTGFAIVGVLLASAIVVWDWRYTLVCLVGIQGVVGAASVVLLQAPVQWALIQFSIIALCCAIIGMSAYRTMSDSPTVLQSGSWWLRFMALALLFGGWILLDVQVELPEVDVQLIRLFSWIAACGLLMLGLGSNPFYAMIALLLWTIPVQAYISAVVEIPTLVVLVGLLQILMALAGSYLLIAEDAPDPVEHLVLTDVAFPADVVTERPLFGLASVADALESRVRSQWHRVDSSRNPLVRRHSSSKASADTKTDVEHSVEEDQPVEGPPIENRPAEDQLEDKSTSHQDDAS